MAFKRHTHATNHMRASLCMSSPNAFTIIRCTFNKSKMPDQHYLTWWRIIRCGWTLHNSTNNNPYEILLYFIVLIISVPIEIFRHAFCTLTLLFLVIMLSHFNIQYVILLFDPIKLSVSDCTQNPSDDSNSVHTTESRRISSLAECTF